MGNPEIGASAGVFALPLPQQGAHPRLTGTKGTTKIYQNYSGYVGGLHEVPIEKVIVWDGGGKDGGMSNLGGRLMGALPPMHDLAKQVGLELPDFLGKMKEEAEKKEAEEASE